MDLIQKIKPGDINSLYEEYCGCDGALLVDVRSEEEYLEGHIPGSISIPLNSLSDIDQFASNLEQKIYVYCLSGYRSRNAQSVLNSMGYTNVVNMGAFSQYVGEREY